MKAMHALPEGYEQIFSVDLQKNKKTALLVNLWSIAIALAMVIPMHFNLSILTLFDMSRGIGAYLLRFAIFLVFLIAYLIIHELVHGAAMKFFGTEKVKYGFTGLYAFAGSEDYYDKKSYIIIALAPVAVLGVIIAIINILVPAAWFWVIYIIQVCNVSGAAGDLYVTLKFLDMPKDILVRDSGVSMAVYSQKTDT